eukprot:TRINITY_DN4286_c0_g1_i1.p2 TRINITY_DN4286_c0_g1~~TRINITY_DN4286_c0_g1_i1.p2  ORF type:complete len:208 (-),score=41.12 TRINITY_DN4286_c0_g1_i1:614-1237(-)
MANNAKLFQKQQKEAFFYHHFDAMSKAELEVLITPFKSTRASQFPSPETIYYKRFPFLSAPLAYLHKNETECKACHENILKDTVQVEPPSVERKQKVIDAKGFPRIAEKRSKFGIALEEFLESEEEEETLIIPAEIEEAIRVAFGSAHSKTLEEECKLKIERASFSPMEVKMKSLNGTIKNWMEQAAVSPLLSLGSNSYSDIIESQV